MGKVTYLVELLDPRSVWKGTGHGEPHLTTLQRTDRAESRDCRYCIARVRRPAIIKPENRCELARTVARVARLRGVCLTSNG